MIGAAIVAVLVVAAQAAPAPLPECDKGQFRQLDGGCGAQMPQMPMQMPPFNPMMGYPMMPGYGGMWPGYGGYMGGNMMPHMPQMPQMPHSGGMPFGMPFGMPPMTGETVHPMPPMNQESGGFGQMPPGFSMESYDMSYFYPKKDGSEEPAPMMTTTEAPKVEIAAPKAPETQALPQPPIGPVNPKPVKVSRPPKDPQALNRPKQITKDPPGHHLGQQQPMFGSNYPNLQSLFQLMNSHQQPHKQQRPQKQQKPGKFHKKPEPQPEVEPEKSELPPFKYITDFSEEDYTALERVKAPKQSLQQPPPQHPAAPRPVAGCPAVDDRYKPVHMKHENCRMFYKCSNGQAVVQECPPHLMWSEAADRCVVMLNGQC